MRGGHEGAGKHFCLDVLGGEKKGAVKKPNLGGGVKRRGSPVGGTCGKVGE